MTSRESVASPHLIPRAVFHSNDPKYVFQNRYRRAGHTLFIYMFNLTSISTLRRASLAPLDASLSKQDDFMSSPILFEQLSSPVTCQTHLALPDKRTKGEPTTDGEQTTICYRHFSFNGSPLDSSIPKSSANLTPLDAPQHMKDGCF